MYNEFYGFLEKPFESLPDPRFLFFTNSYRKILTSVMEGIKNRRGFISITGEVGTGKTTLIRYLLSRLEEEGRGNTALIFHPTITFKELLKNILLELDLEVIKASQQALLGQLNEYLTAKDLRDETLIIIIDEAQDLPKEAMEELGRLPKSPALQIVFVGQPEFEVKLNSQGQKLLKQSIAIQHQLKALSEDESRDYINHRLTLVRSSSSERFTPEAISTICSYAKGVPRVINNLCDNGFLRGYSLSRKKIDADIIREVIRSMEGPLPRRTFFSSLATAAKDSRLFPPGSSFHLRRISLIVLVLLCLGGFVFLIHRSLQPGTSSISLPVQIQTEPISKSSTHQESDKLKPVSLESPRPASPPAPPLARVGEEATSTKMITVKSGYTISSLTETYYGVVNLTLIDLILEINPEISNVHLILVEQKVKIPALTKELLVKKSAENTFEIQVGTFRTPEFVRYYVNEPALKGREVKAFPRKVSPRETWYRVVAGPFSDKKECFNAIDQLKEKKLLPAFGGFPKTE